MPFHLHVVTKSINQSYKSFKIEWIKFCKTKLISSFSLYHSLVVSLTLSVAAGLCNTKPTDLVFIIDSSRSVRPSEFEQVKVFLAKVIDGLDVGPDATRVGVVNYASRVKNEVSLKSHRTKAGLIKAVSKIEPLSSGTMTGLSIQFAMNVAFSEGEGARTKSPDISKVRYNIQDIISTHENTYNCRTMPKSQRYSYILLQHGGCQDNKHIRCVLTDKSSNYTGHQVFGKSLCAFVL